MLRVLLLAMVLPATFAWSTPIESADIQPPSAWMLALLFGLGIKIFRTLGRS